MNLIELGFAQELQGKIIHTDKLLLINRGFNIYMITNGSVQFQLIVAEELLELNSKKKRNE